jgi:hypothetical protein
MGRLKNRFTNEGWVREVPSGTPNGVLTTFNLTYQPDDSDGVTLTLDGLVLRKTTHYTISGTTITMVAGAPNTDQVLYAVYTRQT